jgi:NitT/TauT family transport system ATP-binding protein
MSARPGNIEHVIDVNLDRKAGEEVMKSRAFVELSEHIWDLVRQQAIAATRGEL